jgi:putative peptidoglycan lipid II flippase
MKKAALLIMVITIISKVLGFGREIVLAYFYGASSVSDVYLIALTIPGVIFAFIGTGIATGYIPMYSKIKAEEGIENANKYTNNLVNIVLILCSSLVILGLIFTEELVKIFALGFEGETLKLAVTFTKITLVAIYFSALIYIFNGYLQLKDNYTIPALIGLPLNLIIIISIFVSTITNTVVLAIGFVLATVSQLIFLLPFIYRQKFRYRPVFQFKDKHIIKMTYISIPIIIGASIDQVNILVDRTIASQIVDGGISALNYANRLNLFIQGIFVLSIATVLYPNISRMAAEKNLDKLKNTLSVAITGIIILVLPASIGMMLFAEPIVQLLFGRGAFGAQDINMTSNALFFYSIGMIGFGLREILSKAFFAVQDTKTPMINAGIAVLLNIILNVILSKFLGLGGLALATSISAILCSFLLFISLKRKIGLFKIKKMVISLFKVSIASVAMALTSKIIYMSLLDNISGSSALLLSIGVGIFSYLVVLLVLKIEELNSLIKIIRLKLKAWANF